MKRYQGNNFSLRVWGSALFLGIVVGTFVLAYDAFGATNISSIPAEHFAWNDIAGWIDFYNTDTVTVSSAGLTGYASSSVGDVSFDCATTRAGNICGTSQYQVTNDGAGNLSGYGWNDVYGWVSFNCADISEGTCAAAPYRVLIDPLTGIFQNYAWNDVAGWVSFNCSNPGNAYGCETSDYKVKTDWVATPIVGTLDSATFDTGVSQGAQLNSVLWRGDEPPSTEVRFQFSASNTPDGPWDFSGPDGTSNSYYVASPGVTKNLSYTLYNDKRYFRYRITLVSDIAQSVSPRVDEVIVNWSP